MCFQAVAREVHMDLSRHRLGEIATDYHCRRLGRMLPAMTSTAASAPNTTTTITHDPVNRPVNPANTRPPVRCALFNFRLALILGRVDEFTAR